MPDITRETFEAMDTDSKLNVLFDYARAAHETAMKVEEKTERLEMKSARWGAVGGVFSAIGAFLAYLFIGHISTR